MEEEEQEEVYLERAKDEDEQKTTERTCGKNECCFFCAFLIVICSFLWGAIFSLVTALSENTVWGPAGTIISSIVLVVGVYCAARYAGKGPNPRAVRPAGLEPLEGQWRFRMIVRPRGRQARDIDVESARPLEVNFVDHAIPGPSRLQPPEIRVSDVDLQMLGDPSLPRSSRLQAPEIRVSDADLQPAEKDEPKLPETAASGDASSNLIVLEKTLPVDDIALENIDKVEAVDQTTAGQPGPTDSASGGLLVEQSLVRQRRQTPELGISSSDDQKSSQN